MSEESKLPWFVKKGTSVRYSPTTGEKFSNDFDYVRSADDQCISVFINGGGDAELVVKAVNVHQELIETLSELLEALSEVDTTLNSSRIIDRLGAAETKANDVLRRAK